MIFGYTSLFAALFLCFSLNAADQKRASSGDDFSRPAQLNTERVEGRARSASLTTNTPADTPTREWMHDRFHPSSPVGNVYRTYAYEKDLAGDLARDDCRPSDEEVAILKVRLRRAGSDPSLSDRIVAAQLVRAVSDPRFNTATRVRRSSLESSYDRGQEILDRERERASEGSSSSDYHSANDKLDPSDGI